MRKITLSVDEEVIAKVRRHAHDRGTTVNALMRLELERIAGHEDRVEGAMRELREISNRANAETGAITWTREGLHER